MKDWILANSMFLRLAVGLAITCAAIVTVLLAEWIGERLLARERKSPAAELERLERAETQISSLEFDSRLRAGRGAANDGQPRAA